MHLRRRAPNEKHDMTDMSAALKSPVLPPKLEVEVEDGGKVAELPSQSPEPWRHRSSGEQGSPAGLVAPGVPMTVTDRSLSPTGS